MTELKQAIKLLRASRIEVEPGLARCYGVETHSGNNLHALMVIVSTALAKHGLALSENVGGNDHFLYVTYAEVGEETLDQLENEIKRMFA
jgi:hypothetical protein